MNNMIYLVKCFGSVVVELNMRGECIILQLKLKIVY
jgi:hypothetical protein